MKDDIAISIIIPIYNAEHFMKKGLDSCINQTMENIEIICINNASEDNSALVIDEYVKKDPDKVIRLDCTENRGPGGARNQGILYARGEYLCFMDSDDYLDVHLCEDAYKKAKVEDADILFYDYIRVDGKQEHHVEWIGAEELNAWGQQIGYAPWKHIIRRDIILKHELFFPEDTGSEDDAIVPLWRYYAKKRCKLHKPYYYYVNRKNSLVNEIKISSVMSAVITAIPYRYHIMKQKGLLDKYKAESDLMISKDISLTLEKLMNLKGFFTQENILNMHKQVEFLSGKKLDDSVMKYNMTYLDMELVNDFLNCPDIIVEKYGDFENYTYLQKNNGLCVGIEDDIKDILSKLQVRYGLNMIIWGAGRVGLPIISTLYRMGYHMHVYDNAKCGGKVMEEYDECFRGFAELSKDCIDVVLVTSEEYYKEIEKQIHEYNRDIPVVNFRRMIRLKSFEKESQKRTS